MYATVKDFDAIILSTYKNTSTDTILFTYGLALKIIPGQ